MKKQLILVAALLMGGTYLTGCNSSSRMTGRPTGSSTATLNQSVSPAPADISSQPVPDRVSSGTVSGSTITGANNPSMNLNAPSTDTPIPPTTGNYPTDKAVYSNNPVSPTTAPGTTTSDNTASTTSDNSNANRNANESSVTSSQSINSASTTGDPIQPTTGTKPTDVAVYSANPSNTPASATTTQSGNSSNSNSSMNGNSAMAPERRSSRQTGNASNSDVQRMNRETEIPSTAPVTDQASKSSSQTPQSSSQIGPRERERANRDQSNPDGMAQRQAASDMNSAQKNGSTYNSSLSSTSASESDQLIQKLDDIDAQLAQKMTAKKRAALVRQRKSIMLQLGKAKSAEAPTSTGINQPDHGEIK